MTSIASHPAVDVWILGHEHPNHPDLPAGTDRGHEIVHRRVRNLITLRSHHPSLDQAPDAYKHFDARDDGWTKLVLHGPTVMSRAAALGGQAAGGAPQQCVWFLGRQAQS